VKPRQHSDPHSTKALLSRSRETSHRAKDGLGRLASGASRRPAIFFVFLVAVSAVAYIPMALAFNPMRWTTLGPFAFYFPVPLLLDGMMIFGSVAAGGVVSFEVLTIPSGCKFGCEPYRFAKLLVNSAPKKKICPE
jgi:hypothetical protein